MNNRLFIFFAAIFFSANLFSPQTTTNDESSIEYFDAQDEDGTDGDVFFDCFESVADINSAIPTHVVTKEDVLNNYEIAKFNETTDFDKLKNHIISFIKSHKRPGSIDQSLINFDEWKLTGFHHYKYSQRVYEFTVNQNVFCIIEDLDHNATTLRWLQGSLANFKKISSENRLKYFPGYVQCDCLDPIYSVYSNQNMAENNRFFKKMITYNEIRYYSKDENDLGCIFYDINRKSNILSGHYKNYYFEPKSQTYYVNLMEEEIDKFNHFLRNIQNK